MDIPLLHIVDCTAVAINKSHQQRVGLLATKLTMEEAFYTERMRDKFGIEVIVPSPTSRQLVHEVIYQELCHGVIRETSRAKYQEIIRELVGGGAECIILGCTEIELLISDKDSVLPTYPSTAIHAHAAVDLALGG